MSEVISAYDAIIRELKLAEIVSEQVRAEHDADELALIEAQRKSTSSYERQLAAQNKVRKIMEALQIMGEVRERTSE